MKLSERKSKVVCINGTLQNRKWRCGETEIRDVEEYQYLGVTVQGGKNGGFKSMGDRMVEANGVIGMIKYAAKRSGNKYVIGREGWKGIAVSKLMYGCGALRFCDSLVASLLFSKHIHFRVRALFTPYVHVFSFLHF